MLEQTEQTTSARRVWLETAVDAIANNTRRVQQYIGETCRIIGVVKANGYGHGATIAAGAMLDGGAHMLAVATVGEGRALRRAGIAVPILVMGPAWSDEIGAAIQLQLTLTVGDLATFQAVIAAVESGHTVQAHLKIDTGMHRLGLLPYEVVPLLQSEPAARAIMWDGLFTHFACADEPGRNETVHQITCFEDVCATLTHAGFVFPLVHAANSAAALAFPRVRYNAVRPGIALYGVAPSEDVQLPPGFAPALRFCTRVVRIVDLPAGSPVSYGGSYITPGPRRIATIAAGYADGLRRSPPWREVLVNGKRAPVVGRICMDYAMIDITGIECEAGAEVVLLGAQGDDTITVEEVAGWLGTSVYEVLTSVGK